MKVSFEWKIISTFKLFGSLVIRQYASGLRFLESHLLKMTWLWAYKKISIARSYSHIACIKWVCLKTKSDCNFSMFFRLGCGVTIHNPQAIYHWLIGHGSAEKFQPWSLLHGEALDSTRIKKNSPGQTSFYKKQLSCYHQPSLVLEKSRHGVLVEIGQSLGFSFLCSARQEQSALYHMEYTATIQRFPG